MTTSGNRTRWIGYVGLLSVGAIGAAAYSSTAPNESAVWQHHQETTTYFGTTSRYTCEGLEEKTKQMLRYFGARPDVKVRASCPDLVRPVEHAVVHADFYTLTPANAGAPDSVPGRWVEVVLRPRHPSFMDMGECELVQQVKGLVTKDFSARALHYDTACVAHATTIEDYRISAQVLEPADTR